MLVQQQTIQFSEHSLVYDLLAPERNLLRKINNLLDFFSCHDLINLSDYVKQINTATFKLLKRSFVGPYNFILSGNNNFSKEFKKKTTVGIRVPVNTTALEMIRQSLNPGNPIVSTSIRDEDEVIKHTSNPELIIERWRNLVDLISGRG